MKGYEMKRLVTLSALSVLAAGMLASAGALAQAAMTEGSVEKIDQAAGKITLNHGPIKNLDMDAMKMVFRVKEASMLDGLKVGQKIKFEADRVNGQITVTRIEKGK
jgi:Cu(I)/Ag(I) efflux system periplasmic protein CusF